MEIGDCTKYEYLSAFYQTAKETLSQCAMLAKDYIIDVLRDNNNIIDISEYGAKALLYSYKDKSYKYVNINKLIYEEDEFGGKFIKFEFAEDVSNYMWRCIGDKDYMEIAGRVKAFVDWNGDK
jgi:hypothetical protein